MTHKDIINWLLRGDVSIQYQTHRDLLDTERPGLQAQIATEGWGKKYLSLRKSDGHWGQKFYQPKWTSTHYTLLDLKNLAMPPDCEPARDSIREVLLQEKGPDGGIRPIGTVQKSDVCINGMFLNYASWFGAEKDQLESVVDFILSEIMPDGGFNCQSNRKGAVHSSLHSTLSVMEGIHEYLKNGYVHRKDDLIAAQKSSLEFILQHRLFRSDKTGEIIDRKMLNLTYPGRWRYDILRALDHFRDAGFGYDERMKDGFEVIMKKRTKENTWKLQANHPGQVHFHMEETGKPSRWNTLRALRVLKHFNMLNRE